MGERQLAQRSPTSGRSIGAVAFVAVACGSWACSVAKPKLAEEVSNANANANAPEWNNSALWLYAATRSGTPQQECGVVQATLVEEMRCKGALCRFSAELSEEWLAKCTTLVPDGKAPVANVREHSVEQAAQQPSACAKEHEKLVDECSTPECHATAQKWATRCAETEAGPIAVRMLERAIERGGGKRGFKLEVRGCATLKDLQQAAVRCADSSACAEGYKLVTAYRAHCLDGGKVKPELSVAAWQLAISLGAGENTDPIVVRPEPSQLPTGALAVSHTDGGGAMVRVCQQPAASPQAYLKARTMCEQGAIDFVRVFDGEQGPEMKLAKVYINKELPLTALYPSLRIYGELAHQEEVALGDLVYTLGDVTSATGDDAVSKLLLLAEKNARWMQMSVPIGELFRSNDAKIAPILERIAKLKVEGAKGIYDRASLRGLAQRAHTRPFADMNKDGKVELAAGGAAFFLDATKLFPEAMKRYRAALEALDRSVRTFREPAPMELNIATTFGTAQAKSCGDAQNQMRLVQFQLLECATESDGCADDKHQDLLTKWFESRDQAEQARRMLDIARGALGEEGVALDLVARQARCGQPWW